MKNHEQLDLNNPFNDLSGAIPGLAIHQNTGELYFPNPELTLSLKYSQRYLNDMTPILCDPETSGKTPDRVVHRIYRTIGDKPEWIASDIKYDITVILPGDWNNQCPTTTGHYHLPISGQDNSIPSPDFYQLIDGEIIAVMQKETADGTDIRLLRPKPGNWILIPGEYAHTVVNIGQRPAVFANICVRSPHLNYKPITEKRGMGIYVARDKTSKQIKIVRNRNYDRIASLTFAESTPVIPGFEAKTHKVSLYNLLCEDLADLQFLTSPAEYPHVFQPDPIVPLVSPDG